MSRLLDTTLVTLIALTLLAPLVVRARQRRLDPFEPIVFFSLAYGVMFVLRPAGMLITDSLVFEGPRQTLDVSETFTETLVLALVGGVAFLVGYALPIGDRLASRRNPERRDPAAGRLVAASILVALVGACSFGLLVLASGGFDFIEETVRSGRNTELLEPGGLSLYARSSFLVLIPAALVLLALGLERRSTWLKVGSFVLVALVVAQASPIGSRGTLLPLLGGIFVLYNVRRSARPSWATILVVGALAVLGSSFLSDLRGRTTRSETFVETIERATSPSRLLDSVATGPDAEMAPALAVALSVVPERLPYTYGKTIFGDLVVRPVPRAWWADKPLIPRHELLAEAWPVEFERGNINAEFSSLLYFYWDFGLIGVMLGLAVYGVLARYLYEYFRSNDKRLYAQVFFSLAVWFAVIALRDSPVDTFVRAWFVLLPVAGMFWLARTRLPIPFDDSISAAIPLPPDTEGHSPSR
jgi:hypothetical protein